MDDERIGITDPGIIQGPCVVGSILLGIVNELLGEALISNPGLREEVVGSAHDGALLGELVAVIIRGREDELGTDPAPYLAFLDGLPAGVQQDVIDVSARALEAGGSLGMSWNFTPDGTHRAELLRDYGAERDFVDVTLYTPPPGYDAS